MTRTKRTHNRHAAASRPGAAGSQDPVVELATTRPHDEVTTATDAEQWAVAADDPEFEAETSAIARHYDNVEVWLTSTARR